MGRLLTLTAKTCDGQDYTIPRTIYAQEDAIVIDTARGTGTNKTTKVTEKLANRTRAYQVYEKAMQIEAQRNPASTDILVKQQIKTGLSAAGATQGAALALTAYMSEVTTATAGSADGVVLPAATLGKTMVVINNAATAPVKVYPAVGEFIGSALVNVSVSIAAGSRASFVCTTTAGKWIQAIDRGQ